MNNAFLTATEIYELDNLTEEELEYYIDKLPLEKVGLVLHVYSKNREIKVWKGIADENKASVLRLAEVLKSKRK
ncbi:MAG: hypothetical protein FWG63_06480 [Defluviitaleaceae bacterium]|nr:hypothetical protein [Defluviitaleaceae bacterium]